MNRKIELLKINTKNKGFTMVEVLAVLLILGVLAIVAVPIKSWAENPLGDATKQTVGILNLIRMRAISTTSAYRIKLDPDVSGNKYKVEIAKTRGCESLTELTADVESTEQELTVDSTEGLVVGDSIIVGTDEYENEIIATSASTITLGKPLGTSQKEKANIELINNWFKDIYFSQDNLTLPEEITIHGNPTNWTLCFDSRGHANVYDPLGVLSYDLTLTLTNTANKSSSEITIFRGGAVKVEYLD